MQDTPAIITLLQTLNSNCDSTVRKNAENMLLSSLPQSILPLLQIATDPSIDTNARLLAAIVCKNHILSNPLPENDIITCINAVMPSLPNCPHRISVMLSFFLEALTRNHASSRIALIRQSSQQLPSTLNVLDALLCYTFITSDELSILCEKDGVCDKLLNCVESHCDPIAMKIIGGIVPFIGVEESNSFAVMVIQRVPISIINVLNGDSLLGWYHALQLLRIISSDAPHIVEENFEKLLNKVMDVTQKVIELQQQNQWQTLDVVSDLPYDIKDGILIGLVDVFSVFASLDLYRKRNIQKVGDIATSVVRLLCSPTQDWYFPFDCLSHTAAQNVQQTSSSTLAEAGIIFLHNIILYQTLPVNVLFVSSFQLLQQGAALLQSHKRNFVNYRGTGLLILTVCGDYLSKAQVHIQKEVNAIIIDVVRTDFQLLDTISYDDFIEHDICYALACITSILPSATYNDLTFFLSALMSSYSKLLQDVVVLPFTLRLLTKCLSIPDFTISPYFTSFFSLVLNSLNVSNDELPYVFDTLSAYCQHLSSAAGTLTQTLVAALLRCFLQNPISPNVRHSLIQIFTILFKNRPLFLRVMEYLMPPLPTVYAFCSRQSNDYSTQTALLLTLLIVKYSMALGEGLIHLVMLALSAGRTTTSCLSISVQLASAIMQKYVNIMDTQEGQTIVSTILQNIDEAVKIGLLENEEMVKDSCSVLLLMSIFHGEKIGDSIIQIASRGNDTNDIELECVFARAWISFKNNKDKMIEYIPRLLKKAINLHDGVKDKGAYFGKIHGIYMTHLLGIDDIDSITNGDDIPISILVLHALYQDYIGMEQLYTSEKLEMEEHREGTIDMSDDDDDWDDDYDYDDGFSYASLGEGHVEISEAIQNKELELLAHDDLFYSSYKDFLSQFFITFKQQCTEQRLYGLQQSALRYSQELYELLK